MNSENEIAIRAPDPRPIPVAQRLSQEAAVSSLAIAEINQIL